MGERTQLGDAGIGHGCVFEVETLEGSHLSNRFESFIRHLTSREIQPDDAVRDRFEELQLVISEFLRCVDDVDAKSIIFRRDRHDGEMILLRREENFVHPFLLFLRSEGVPDGIVGRDRSIGHVLGGAVARFDSEGESFDGRIFPQFSDFGLGLGSGFDPEAEKLDFFWSQGVSFRRHEFIVIRRQGHSHDQLGLVRIAGDHGGKIGTFRTGEKQLVGIHPELAFDLVFVVTLVALGLEDGDDEIRVDKAFADGDLCDALFTLWLFFLSLVRGEPKFKQGDEWLGGMLGEVVSLVDHRSAKVTARHRHCGCRKDREGRKSEILLRGKYNGEERADDHGEAEVHVQIHGPAFKALHAHEEISDEGGRNGSEKGDPVNEGDAQPQVLEGGETRQELHGCTEKDHSDGEVYDDDVETRNEIQESPTFSFVVPVGKPHQGKKRQPDNSEKDRQFPAFGGRALMFYKRAHVLASLCPVGGSIAC